MNIQGYCPGHCWYYLLGGHVLSPKAILNAVKASDYKGYMQDRIASADQKLEPSRSEALRKIRGECLESLKEDISRYRCIARKLYAYRKDRGFEVDPSTGVDDVHMATSLKHNHIYNEFAHLVWLDDLLAYQPDLFG